MILDVTYKKLNKNDSPNFLNFVERNFRKFNCICLSCFIVSEYFNTNKHYKVYKEKRTEHQMIKILKKPVSSSLYVSRYAVVKP